MQWRAKMDTLDGVLFGFICLMLLLIAVTLFLCMSIKDTEELGQSICEEEYSMDFESYMRNELTCKDRIVSGNYDGIKIVLTNN